MHEHHSPRNCELHSLQQRTKATYVKLRATNAGFNSCERLEELERGASAKAEDGTSDLRRVGGDAIHVAHIAPEAPQEHLQPAVLVAGA